MRNKYVVIAGLLLVFILVYGCSNPNGTLVVDGDSSPDTIMLDSDGTILPDKCEERGLNDKIIMIESEYCTHCNVIKPILIEIEKEKEIDIIFLDVSKKEDRDRIKNELHIDIRYTPTVLIGCNVVIGERSKEKYEQLIDEFLEG